MISIEVENLTKIYGKQKALDNVSFSLNQGEIVGLLGPNGAGKSTTMKILTCYLPQTSGKVTVCGLDVVKDALKVKSKIGYLPENNPLYHDMFVKEYLGFMANLKNTSGNRKEWVNNVIELTGISAEQHKKIGQLSKGYKQRVGLAQALLNDPEILILDEPTSGLDPNQIVEIRELIKQVGKDRTVVLSTHILQEVEIMCNRVIIINKGQKVADDNIAEIKNKIAIPTINIEFDKHISTEKLRSFASVISVEKITDFQFRIATHKTQEVKKAIFDLSLNENIGIKSIFDEKENLEATFKSVTKGI